MPTQNKYTTKTAALRATKADISKINVKKLFLDGENILDIIRRAIPIIKHSQDTRETITENDIWGQWIETKADGTIVIHDVDEVVNPNGSTAWNTSITKVENNKAYVNDTLYGNIQTEKIKNGSRMFRYCYSLTSFNSNLSSLTNGNAMFSDTKLTSFKCDNLFSLQRGNNMFNNCNITKFDYYLPNLTDGNNMFMYCDNLKDFTSNLPNITHGSAMFQYCSNLKKFTINIPTLISGSNMFCNCPNLTLFISDLPNLTNGSGMFDSCKNLASFDCYNLHSLSVANSMFNGCINITTFTSDLSNLTTASNMFKGCTNLTTFASDLSSLTYGSSMFNGCSNFISFYSDLSSLLCGSSMFSSCKLNAESVMYIADTIKDIAAEKQLYIDGTIPYITSSNDVYSAPKGFKENGDYVIVGNNTAVMTITATNVGSLTLGINVSNNADTIQQQLEDFAQEATFDSWEVLKTHFSKKGWTVAFQYGGTTDEIPNTYNIRNGEQIIPCPIFAKLIEVDKDFAQYCTEDASSFYNIEWGHDVTDTSSYTQFDSLEDAMASWNVFPKENIITTEKEEEA